MSNRIVINEIDLSTTTTSTSTSVVGFTVVDAPKGSITPVLISANGTSKLKDVFGASSADYPELYEVETFIDSYDCYVSAPYDEAKVPVAYVTPYGIFKGANLVDYNSTVEDYVFDKYEGDGTDLEGILSINSTTILKDMNYPLSNGMGATKDIAGSYPSYTAADTDEGTPASITINSGLTEELLLALSEKTFVIKNLPALDDDSTEASFYIEGEDIDSAEVYQSGSTDRVVGSLTTLSDGNVGIVISGWTNTEGVDPENILTTDYVAEELDVESVRSALETYWACTITEDDVYATIFPKYPSNRALHISFTSFNANRNYDPATVDGRNILKMTVYEDNAFHNSAHTVSVTGSLNTTATDASGSTIGFTASNSSYSDQELVCVAILKAFTDTKQIKNKSITQYPAITLEGGYRRSNTTDSNTHQLGWEEAIDEDYAIVDIFFDSERHSTNPIDDTTNSFFDLSQTHSMAGYIFNYTVDPDNVSSMTTPITVGDENDLTGARYWNVCNEAIMALSTGEKITSPMTGAFAKMMCRIIDKKYGGVAPMYTNSSGMGGQLGISPVRMRYKYTKDQQEALVDLNINPIIYDHTYGVMCVGQQTCKPGDMTDWSYIGHVASFLNFEKEVKINVMIPQLGKANNSYYRTLRAQQVEAMLRKRCEGDGAIWAAGYVDTSTAEGVNDSAARLARKFVLNTGIKTNVFSEFIELNFTTYSQDTNLFEISENTIGSED